VLESKPLHQNQFFRIQWHSWTEVVIGGMGYLVGECEGMVCVLRERKIEER
jgi:hypothetical protein